MWQMSIFFVFLTHSWHIFTFYQAYFLLFTHISAGGRWVNEVVSLEILHLKMKSIYIFFLSMCTRFTFLPFNLKWEKRGNFWVASCWQLKQLLQAVDSFDSCYLLHLLSTASTALTPVSNCWMLFTVLTAHICRQHLTTYANCGQLWHLLKAVDNLMVVTNCWKRWKHW